MAKITQPVQSMLLQAMERLQKDEATKWRYQKSAAEEVAAMLGHTIPARVLETECYNMIRRMKRKQVCNLLHFQR